MLRIFFILIIFISYAKVFAKSTIKEWRSTLPIDSQFEVSEKLSERVEFWIKIYSFYNSNQGVFHLVDDPSFILGEVDLSPIMNNYILTNSEKRKLSLKYLADKRSELIQKWKLADSTKIRLQMGLKDRMQNALFVSGRYLPMMESIFKKKGLPVELTRIVFVESSFNVHAQSKVGASGLWQIMPSVAKPMGYINANYDKRNHPLYATELASDILRTNFNNLGSWPLAITAYNHGMTGVKKMVEKNKSNQIEDLIESDQVTSSWGFASKNFYSCFLAVLEVEKNALSLFGQNLVQSKTLNTKEFKLSKSVSKTKILTWYNGSLTRLKQLNPHLNWSRLNKSKKIPAGVPLLIPKENFYLVSK